MPNFTPGKGQPWLHVQAGRQEAGEQPCRKGSGGFGQQQIEYEPVVCLGSHIHLLNHGLLHRQQCGDLLCCGTHGLQGDSLLHQGPFHRLQGNCCSGTWSTSCPPSALTWCLQGWFSLLAVPAAVVCRSGSRSGCRSGEPVSEGRCYNHHAASPSSWAFNPARFCCACLPTASSLGDGAVRMGRYQRTVPPLWAGNTPLGLLIGAVPRHSTIPPSYFEQPMLDKQPLNPSYYSMPCNITIHDNDKYYNKQRP